MNILVVIPARGGSKGIPRKNLRTLAGKPLIYYSIQTALQSYFKPDVYVSSEDEEILMVARKCGAQVHRRPIVLGDDKTTLDPVIQEAYRSISINSGKKYDLVITMQPTSPLLRAASLDLAIEKFISDSAFESVISVRKEAHLSWKEENGRYIPNYKERVNRQYLSAFFPETGAFVISRASLLDRESKRIGDKIDLYVLPANEAIDIDTYEDWNICEYLLKRKTILFVVSGFPEIGLGHIYRALILANSILDHHLIFLVDKKSYLGYSKIKSEHYEVNIQTDSNIIDDIKKLNPDVIINDILDTSIEYVRELKAMGLKVVNFEDLGSGAKIADLVINALYPEKDRPGNHYFGHSYFCARDEFMISEYKEIGEKVQRVLITMGGVDPCNLTLKILDSIYDDCISRGIEIDVVLGLGYQRIESISKYSKLNLYQDIKTMSDFMLKADIVFTSAGRTVYEAACIGTPTIVLAQNEREMTHFFASSHYGFVNLGLGVNVRQETIRASFNELILDMNQRQEMNRKMLMGRVREGKFKVLKLIKDLIGG